MEVKKENNDESKNDILGTLWHVCSNPAGVYLLCNKCRRRSSHLLTRACYVRDYNAGLSTFFTAVMKENKMKHIKDGGE